jgi:hypothetical protein
MYLVGLKPQLLELARALLEQELLLLVSVQEYLQF